MAEDGSSPLCLQCLWGTPVRASLRGRERCGAVTLGQANIGFDSMHHLDGGWVGGVGVHPLSLASLSCQTGQLPTTAAQGVLGSTRPFHSCSEQSCNPPPSQYRRPFHCCSAQAAASTNVPARAGLVRFQKERATKTKMLVACPYRSVNQ
jgi:hypothetical protein